MSEVDTYKAIAALAELVKNTKPLQQAAAVLAKSFALTDEEVARREEYNTILNSANERLADLKKRQFAIDDAVEKNTAVLRETDAKVAAIKREHDQKTTEQADRDAALQTRESALSADEKKMAQIMIGLNGRERDAAAKEQELAERETAVAARESKITDALKAIGQ